MALHRASQIAAAGLAVQKARLEAAALNLSNMNTSIAPGSVGYKPVAALIQPARVSFSAALRGEARPWASARAATQLVDVLAHAAIVPMNEAGTRSEYQPGHPHADEAGMVSYPAVDHTREMMGVMAALRAYEANLAVIQISRTLAAKTLEIGSR